MSHPQPPKRQPTASETERYVKAVHNAALVAVIACPVLALLPPRKLDIYTIGLVGVTGYSANYLLRESSGRSIWQYASRQQQVSQGVGREASAVGDIQKQRGESARESWKVQRRREIREDVEEGKSFGDMIVDQVWEVWNQGKKTGEDGEGEGDG